MPTPLQEVVACGVQRSSRLVRNLERARDVYRDSAQKDVWAVLVREAVQNSRIEKATPRRTCVLERGELEVDEHVIRIVRAAKDALSSRLFSGPR